jgi:GTP cyclohydrolase I
MEPSPPASHGRNSAGRQPGLSVLAPAPDPLEPLVAGILHELDEDAEREGLARTPERVARSLRFLTGGYSQSLEEVVGNAIFKETYSEMVTVTDIELYSLCEHHLLPFYGKVHIAYIPRDRIVGLSKLPRVVDIFAHRLQVQERLTTQIAEALDSCLHPMGVGVVIEASHLCMMMRGVQKQNAQTITSCMLGAFRSDEKTRAEFLQLIRRNPR